MIALFSVFPIVPQIVILGPPASGKRTISKMVATKLRTAHITPENLIAETEANMKAEAEGFVKRNQVLILSTLLLKLVI